MIFSIVVLLVLTLVSGVLSASEIAVSSANRNKVKMRADGGDRKAARLLALLDEPGSLFATTQFYITFIAFFSGAYAANSFTEPILGFFHGRGVYVPEAVVFIGITVVLTYVTLVFGELVPKHIAMSHAISFALRAVPLLTLLRVVALPFVKLLSASAKGVLRLFGFKGGGKAEVTEEVIQEIKFMVESGREHGHIDENEQDILENIFELDSITAAEICTHRVDVVALPADADFDAVVRVLTAEHFTRLPVYEESLDHIIGILHSKDVLHYMAGSPDTSAFDLRALMREAYFVPGGKKAGELFKEMREERVTTAVVIDEYGGMMGIITKEDMVDIIMGSIPDEYDDHKQPDILPVNDITFRVLGSCELESVQEYFNTKLPVDDYDTLSGFLIGELGYIPADDEKPEVSFGGLLFKVESVREKRVAAVVVVKT